MSTICTPDSTIKSFAAGHKIVSGTINATTAMARTTKSGVVVTTHSIGAFFSGMKYAVVERRSPKRAPTHTPDHKREASLRAARDLFKRAHPSNALIITSK